MAIVQRKVQVKASPQATMALLSDASRWRPVAVDGPATAQGSAR